jgi:hypothetical protein
MLRLFGRVIVVSFGFVLATIAAVVFLLSVGLERMTHALHGKDFDVSQWGQIADVAGGFYSLATVATIVPAILVVIVGEVARIRKSLFYMIGGGASLAALPLLARVGTLGTDALGQIGLIWQVFATAGFIGGLVYWMVAGRSA